MAKYTYKEITDLLLACGFVPEKNNHGSHQSFVHEASGFSVDVPKHPEGVSAGVGEDIINHAVMLARIANINIASDRYRLTNKVIDEIKRQHKKIKENIIFLIPKNQKKISHIETSEDVRAFIKQKAEQIKRWNQKNKKTPEFSD